MNEFSVVCRVLGTLFYRQPQDPLLVPLLTLITEGKLKQHWPLEQDELLTRLQQHCDAHLLATDFNALFVGSECSVSPFRSAYIADANEMQVRVFLQQRGMPLGEPPVDHFGLLLLAASWLEDQSQEDETQAQITLFDEFLLPWCARFLGKVEAHATNSFYRTLAVLTREAIATMRDELAEYEQQEEEPGEDE
ncbi:molecular chaperone [Serratia sp. UGAL515B_01]|uniref:TorD/DmsD family molecular chaperone n=1 Tax=Serratia sp. UGAL515B_01 TaxID=2986763 RepID=UPI00295462C7|nr:molecular chaperone [Serratia sp. UGAL515B_01]WON78458.1 molecular chaperone [Serratia sp. UGAL515B_01]